MALATRCPNCHALFRVVADQLKLRGGLVRCGACHHAFDAIGTLSYVDDATLQTAIVPPKVERKEEPARDRSVEPVTLRIAPAAEHVAHADPGLASAMIAAEIGVVAEANPVAEPVAATATTPPADDRPESETPADAVETPMMPSTSDALPEGVLLTAQPAPHVVEEPVAHDGNGGIPDEPQPTLVGETEASDADASAPALSDAARSGPQSSEEALVTERETELAAESAASDAPAFLQREPTRGERTATMAYRVGAIILGAAFALQLALLYRTELSTQWPATRPALAQACKLFGCVLDWPKRGDLLAVVGTELQSIPGTSVLELIAVVRNRAGFTVAMPALEVTLTDTQNRALVRKVFGPADYLANKPQASARLGEGLEAGADLTVRLTFEAHGINAAGFVVYPFYL